MRYQAKDLPKAYRPMVLSKWKVSLRKGNDYFKLIEPAAYYAAYDTYLARILELPLTEVRLAALDENRDVVLGFSVSRGDVLDYVHVHKDARNMGIAHSLVPSNITTITHLTRTGLTIWGSKFPQWKFNPFA